MIEWPLSALRITGENWHLSGATLTSAGAFGPGTVIHVENRVWMVDLNLTALRQEHWREVRAVLDEARGQYGVISLPVCGVPATSYHLGAITFDGGQTFDAGVTFGAESLEGVTIAQDAPAGATRVRFSGSAAYLVCKAAMFGVGNSRVYRVAKRDGKDLVINPPLREAVVAGDAVTFDKPRARMRLTEDEAALQRVAGGNSTSASFRLMEAL